MTKLNEDTIEKIKGLVAQGQPETTIAALVGVSMVTWDRWKTYGKTDYEEAKETLYRDFWAALQYGKSVFINNNLQIIQKASQKDWKAAAWLLERRAPEYFALKQEVQANVEGITIKNDLPKIDIPTKNAKPELV